MDEYRSVRNDFNFKGSLRFSWGVKINENYKFVKIIFV